MESTPMGLYRVEGLEWNDEVQRKTKTTVEFMFGAWEILV